MLLVPIEYGQESVRLYSSSGSWMNMNPASRVLHYSATDEDHTSWVAFTEHGNGQQWFVLDLSAKMSFDAIQIANCKYDDDCTKDFKWVQNKKFLKLTVLLLGFQFQMIQKWKLIGKLF